MPFGASSYLSNVSISPSMHVRGPQGCRHGTFNRMIPRKAQLCQIWTFL
jgi:hypothetical protein